MGVLVDPRRLDFELQRRGLSARDFGARIGLSEVILSKARNGHRVQSATFRKIASGLDNIPVLAGADAILGAWGDETSDG